MKYLLIITVLCSINFTIAQNDLGVFNNSVDLNNPLRQDSSRYNETSQEYTLKSSGVNSQFSIRELRYLFNKISGDFLLTASFQVKNKKLAKHSKVGWMIRKSKDESSVYARGSLNKKFEILQFERKGNDLIFRAAPFGEPFQFIFTDTFNNLPKAVLAGIFITSNDSDLDVEAKVWNVRIDQPVADNYDSYKEGFLGCRLEILDPFNGKRKVIYVKPDRFEAPNWMPDGKKLLFYILGSLYKIPIEGGNLEKLNTGFADQNNNDHGISFDGKLLAISHHREGFPGGGSTVYTLPLAGGEPKRVTVDTPSYWHGWAPNNKEVVYVAQRKGEKIYNIYKASIEDGKETKLTNFTSGHVDGPEYSPDSKYLYYNSSQSGTMQLWRMSSNGSNQEQITFDDSNDWFPHISPDGKWILYLSFPADIPVNSHPSYKKVLLKIMPVNGGESKVVAYLYGGQGTINVPSWSPDSKYVAFVSNSK